MAPEFPTKPVAPSPGPHSTRAAAQRRAMQAAMAAAVRAMRTTGVRATAERMPRAAAHPPTEA